MQGLKRLQIFILMLVLVLSCTAQAAPNDYLKYQEPQPAATSSFSTFAYILTLIITFAVVIGLAYFTSKFLGQRMGKIGTSGDNRILITFPLGPGKAVYIIELAGKYLILGVTDHSVNLLKEITDQEEIEKLKSTVPQLPSSSSFEHIFENHLSTLQSMSQKFPVVFKQTGDQNEKEGKR